MQEALERWKRLVDPETGFNAPALLHLIANSTSNERRQMNHRILHLFIVQYNAENFITSLDGLDGLPALMRLEVAANRLNSVSTISSNENLPKLRELILVS